ncbi:hypothetical protein [Cellulomonas sp. RIT-PI-Y]|uniref:hypothetical protein n=1 Tax=Cellulomonas sp. RIT-PI-Y TaxID=3035297 RepID=UPI0021DB2672|nr:hypothetical protein [Cellulomonas sp. RIT-PI-Y]
MSAPSGSSPQQPALPGLAALSGLSSEAAPDDVSGADDRRRQLLASAARTDTVRDRFFSHVVRDGADGCWWWTGAVASAGHGRFWVAARTVVIAHRFAWLIHHPGEAELPGLLAHECDNPLCQNPTHLHPSDPGANRREWAARRHRIGGPLRDVRGARERALAVRAALLLGLDIGDALDAGLRPVDAGQGTLFDPP